MKRICSCSPTANINNVEVSDICEELIEKQPCGKSAKRLHQDFNLSDFNVEEAKQYHPKLSVCAGTGRYCIKLIFQKDFTDHGSRKVGISS